jgi:hypothetical protein
VKKHYDLQEQGEIWAPHLRGAIVLGEVDESYQPFVFLVSYQPTGEVTDLWFSYYKDLRATGGRLKLGHGPGGPPNLHKSSLLYLMRTLLDVGILQKAEILDLVHQQPDAS